MRESQIPTRHERKTKKKRGTTPCILFNLKLFWKLLASCLNPFIPLMPLPCMSLFNHMPSMNFSQKTLRPHQSRSPPATSGSLPGGHPMGSKYGSIGQCASVERMCMWGPFKRRFTLMRQRTLPISCFQHSGDRATPGKDVDAYWNSCLRTTRFTSSWLRSIHATWHPSN